jgi:hypothetical protein
MLTVRIFYAVLLLANLVSAVACLVYLVPHAKLIWKRGQYIPTRRYKIWLAVWMVTAVVDVVMGKFL